MDATQMISDSILASDEEDNEEETENKRGRPLAKLCILKNKHIPETEFPLFLGDNVLGRDPNSCTLPLPASSVSKQHATICLSVYRRHGYHSEVDMEALVWDLGSMNGTRKGRLKLTPNVRYALSDGDSLVVADIPCHFVSCGVDPSQGDTRTPMRRNSGVQPRLLDASGEKGDDTSTDSNKCVNGGAETPVRASCLTFEQTPHQPQGTLVPESDSDSDSEKGGRGERRPKALVSDSDSHKSSPSCSSFLSPQTKIVPESEDESPITPSSSKNKPNRYGSFITEETDVDVARQQLEKKKAVAVVEDSEEEEGRENERAAQGGTESTKGEQRVPVKKESSASLTGDNELSTPAVSTDAIPAFNMDSDTDVEGEEEGVASAGTVTLNTNQQVDQPPNTVQFHMNSDTDIDEDDDTSGKAPKSLPSPDKNAKTSHVVPVIQPEAITMDSDTDVDDDDDDAVVSDAATKTEPTLFQSAQTDDSAPSVQPKDFHLDSDTDVDEKEEEEAGECGTKNETNEAPNKLDAKLTAPKSANVAPDSLQLESDTDDEAFPATSKPSVVVAVAESRATADAGADLEIRSDSDTDVEDESPLVIPVAVTTLSVSPSPTSEAFQADSDADTDVDESSAPPAGGEASADDLRVDGDAEDRKSDIGEAGEDQIPRLHKENTPGLLAPLLQNCSTPVQMSEGEVEDMETQAFTSPSSGAFRRAAVPAVRPVILSPCSDSQEDEDFAVAETQSFTFQSRDQQSSEEPTQAFVLETSCDNKNDRSTRGESFQLGLSDSSHLRCPDRALAMESTQAFVSVEGDVNLEDTQAYADILAADGSSAENDLNLEAAQDNEEHEETEKCSVVSEKEGQVDLALEATQAYITDLHSDPEDDTDEDETQNMATSETKPSDFATSSTLAIAETQPMLPIVEDDSLATENPVCSVQQIEPRPQKEDGTKAAPPQEKPLSDAQSVTETQPMCMSDNEESDEDSFPAQRKRTANKLPVEKAQTCDLTCSELSLSETQPMAACEDDDEDSMPGPRKRKAKQLHLEEEETQQLTNSELSAAEPQRMTTCEDDDEDSMPGPRKRKAKQLHLDEEETQPLASSEVSALETQPLGTCEVQQSDEEDGIACPRKRKTKPLQLEEEQTQPLTSTDVETLAGVTGKSKKSDDVASVLGPQKRKAKQIKLKEEETQTLVKSDISAIETRPLKTKTRLSSSEESEVGTSGACVPNLRVTRAKLREEEEQAECSAHSKRQTRGRRGKPLSDDDNKEKVKQAKQVRGKKMKQQKHDGEEEDENPGRERNKHAASKSLIKEQEEGKMREEKDAADLRQERENDKERSIDEREREQDEMERQHRTEDDKLENERRANKQERLQDEKNARAEGEEKPERKIKEKEERIGSEKLETEVERLERERKEQEKEMAKRELIERLEREEKEEREKLEKEKELQEKREEQDKSKTPARGRRAARRTIASQCTTEPEQDSTVSTNDDFPARRTRSRSNSSNSVSSERSASSVSTQDSKGRGRGRGRGTKRTSEPPQTPISRSSNRRTTVAAGTTEQESNSSNSLNSEISSCSVSFQNRGRGGRQRGRGRKTEHDPDSIPSISQSQSDHKSTPITTARGRKSKKAEDCSNDAVHEDDKQDSQPAVTTRGRRQASAATDEKEQSKQACATDESLISKSYVRGRGQRAVKSETVVRPVAPTVSDGDEAKDKRKGRRELEVKAGTDFRCSKGKEKSPKTETAEEEGRDETKGEIPASLQGKKRGRASTTQAKKNAKESVSEGEEKESEEMEVETVKKKVRGRPSVVSRKKKEELEESETSLIGTNQDANVEASEPQTPTSNVSRKRQAPANSSPMAKTPRSSSASPAASPRLRAASQAYKVLFTGVVDEAGEKVLARLGGSMAKDVADMTCLVTDKVRRTVKFLCALAKGVPIVTTDWLEKSGKAGSFLSPTAFIVKDPEQENKFNFSLHESLRIASSQPLLEGYEVHVTKSVKPEPVHMKNIISSSGATFLPKMPSSNKPHTVVISCEEDWPLCRPALSASLPVVTAEFILTGILQQKLDFQSHTLSLSTANVQPAGGRGRGRRQT
ncbi:mediator of DNA damage checkpoint protein 1 isoform X2 [Archocentrus centrarchus]|uniref:mediator of DNA damage checkpoint protein 1 isoform X2 n=1 Tax=Archocentrus centrarchus TaxID=63155 RepID=UPI0011EA4444|nr:mediator of DNA damage checkpoint protein 1 isoform X2 [Archocentrus centrarchus]